MVKKYMLGVMVKISTKKKQLYFLIQKKYSLILQNIANTALAIWFYYMVEITLNLVIFHLMKRRNVFSIMNVVLRVETYFIQFLPLQIAPGNQLTLKSLQKR